MKAYIVRLGTDADHPREIVGFFVAKDPRQLYHMIDECTDVEGCEVMELGAGGIYWGRAVDYVVPHPAEIAEEAPGLPANATVCESWAPALALANEHKWERITSAHLDSAYSWYGDSRDDEWITPE